MRFFGLIFLALAVGVCCLSVRAQHTNPVERQVANPITDTPNINPVSAEQSIAAPKKNKTSFDQEGGDGDVVVYSDKQSVEGEEGKRILSIPATSMLNTGSIDCRPIR